MGKRKADQRHSTERDAFDVATDSEVLRKFITSPKPYTPVVTKPHLPSFDTRTWHPDPITRPIAEPRSASRLKLPKDSAVSSHRSVQDRSRNSRTGTLPATVAFSQPKQVTVCIRRKTRREVLFAKKRTGKGSSAPRTRSQWSDVKC